MQNIYSSPAVRRRLIEFLGGERLETATAAYLTHSDGCRFSQRELRPPSELPALLDAGLDVARSLADSESFLLHLDVEYVNFDMPAMAFTDPLRAFELQEPVVRVIESVLLDWGIRPLHTITGQGHHFVWKIARCSSVAAGLEAIAPGAELLGACLERVPPLLADRIHARDQATFYAIGLVMEFVAHCVKRAAAADCGVPVEVTAVHVGPGASGSREIVSVDISEYGDPLHTRMIRMPFTRYLKPWKAGLAGAGIPEKPISSIPLHEMDHVQALRVRQDEEAVCELARRASVCIPAQETGTANLLAGYLSSRLRRFHEYFYAEKHDPREKWGDTYDRTPAALLHPCARHVLEWPNDLLLKPAGMQIITRTLLAEGWHPRHIAGLIRSKFENPRYQWGIDWGDYEPATRADFYTRLFAGLHLTGLDRLVDFNCTSTREKGFCFPSTGGGCTLEASRARLLAQLPGGD